jgi:diaminohydroxyphosphoribosylaminopyrimidine deaminase / 5-amino-6-(5-phosphoribosylamino)uracil reductase
MHCRRSDPDPASERRKLLLRSETLPQQTSISREIDEAWSVVLDAASHAETLSQNHQHASLAFDPGGRLRRVETGDPDAVIAWRPHAGFELLLTADDPRRALIDLYLPICSATAANPITVGHLGQSLDGFIATHSGESQFVTGEENILHLHRMRALCDAVVVGAGTVAADDPQLTTRYVSGSSPLRVVLDPTRRLAEHYKVFTDDSAVTLYVCAKSLTREGETHVGRAAIVTLDETPEGVDVAEVLRVLRARGCRRIFVEGGGVTVSMFLEANLLDRLQIAIAPLLIGDGRPAIRLAPRSALSDCHRPRYRVFRMGTDVLFDCEIGPDGNSAIGQSDPQPPITRVI